MKYIFAFFLSLLLSPITTYAGPKSTNYELQEYQFGSGGTDTGFSSANYRLFGISGQAESGFPGSTNFQAGNGLIYLSQTGVPPAPSLSNNNNLYYNKLLITINYSTYYTSIPSDILFTIAVSTNFANPSFTKYVQADHTLGDNPVWQSYSTWGGSSGFNLVGLIPNTIYYAQVSARQGNFTQTGLGPASAGVATAPTAISFSVRTVSQSEPPYDMGLGSLTPGSVVATPDQGQVTVTTNASSGALIYIYGNNSGLKSTSQGNYTINSVGESGQNLSLVTEGYGVRGTTVFQNSGHMEISEPYNNGDANFVGPVDNNQRILFTTDNAPVDTGVGRFEIRAKASLTTPPANDYTDTLTIIATSAF